MNVRLQLLGMFLTLGMLAGCGAPGAPQPPSLELPLVVQDLSATRKGDKVTLAWTMPTQTTDGQNIRHNRLGPVQVCRAVGEFPMRYCMQFAGQIPPEQIPDHKHGDKAQRLIFTDTLAPQVQQEHSTEFVTYAVSTLNWRGRSAGLSNQVRVPLAPTLAAPAQIRSGVASDAIVLTWMATPHEHPSPDLRHVYRVYRRQEAAKSAVVIGEVQLHTDPQATFADRSFEWEKTYAYHVTPVTVITHNGQRVAEVEGEDSPEIKVTANDVFAPDAPGGLQAVFSGPGQKPFIDLTWAPNTETDLAGYNVYRHEEGQAAVRLNTELVKTPAFRDEKVEPGKTYFYAVTAVDLRGNESQRSEENSERTPQ
ncbi:MAG TPA: hypothetical protein VD837_00700 [Terriglobales bacterium]|nr:hypothetical protein [Terriglobales bacterium]